MSGQTLVEVFTKARPACFIVEAGKGDKKAANGIIRRAIKVSGAKPCFISEREMQSYGSRSARFTVDLTDEQFAAVMAEGKRLAAIEGWNHFPADAYHD